ncbi:Uma2 family endonuclease [Leptolyngbya sp. FACHB-36]|uniref:Uma2 family endonuclease n=1 Tax=Leptolyngbya sp. FACHB-36 TaxID=2692808 RepID=UPI0018EF8BFC|nr:Uma2 family endonuclease [Leptolyngbya sp. FACHB-36]
MMRVKWSINDYHRMIAAGILHDRRAELLAGEIIEVSPEGPLHASRIRKIANYLRSLLNGLALISEAHPITLMDSEPEPDVAIVRLPESRYDDRHPQVEDIFWLIEISDSTLVKDLDTKQKTYAAAGINEYWVVDLNASRLTVFRQPQGKAYAVRQELSQGELSPVAFPEVVMSIEALFR